MTVAACCTPTPTRTLTRPFAALLPGAAVAGPCTIALIRPAASRVLHALAERWSNWRLAARERAMLEALRRVDARLLRDVGLGHLAAHHVGPSWLDIERTRW